MRIEAEKKDLSRAINLAMLASGRGCKDAALQNILIRLDKGQGSVESFDTHIYSKATFPAKGDAGTEFAVEGTRIQHLTDSATDGPINCEITTDEATVGFSRASIKLRLFPVDKYVRMQVKDTKPVAAQVRTGLLMQALDFVRPFVGKDTQQPTRMLAELRGGRMLAGDGNRIAVVKFGLTGVQPQVAEGEEPPTLSEPDFNFNLRVPYAVLSGVIRWLKDHTEGDDQSLIDILENEDFYFLKSSKGSIFAWRKPEQSFMAIEEHLDKLETVNGASKFKIDKESFERMVDSLSVVLEAGAEKVTFSLNGNPMMPMLEGRALDSRGIPSRNEVQIVIPQGEKRLEGEFSLRFSHVLDTMKLLNSPVVSCDIRKEMSIVQVREDHPEMSKTALLTIMADN